MNNDMITFAQFEKERKRRERRQKIEDSLGWLSGLIRDNKELAIIGIPAVVAITKSISNAVSKTVSANATKKEIQFKERTIYDRSLGRYVELKRPLTPTEALIIEERRARGEKLHEILNDMRLLKR